MEYNVFFRNMPTTVKAFAVNNCDDTFTIVINARLGYHQQQKAFEHELRHILNHDFQKDNVDKIEYNAHMH